MEEAENSSTSPPNFWAEQAQHSPDMPAPMTMMSWVMVCTIWSSGMGSGATSKAHFSFSFLDQVISPVSSSSWVRADTSAPLASARAAAVAFITALLVMVAPDTPSICAVCPAMICSISWAAAAPPTVSVSPEASMATFRIWLASTSRVTVTGPLKPTAEAV